MTVIIQQFPDGKALHIDRLEALTVVRQPARKAPAVQRGIKKVDRLSSGKTRPSSAEDFSSKYAVVRLCGRILQYNVEKSQTCLLAILPLKVT